MPRSILVTGGAGYVGSHVAALLIDEGFDVTVVDNLQTGHRAAVPAGAKFVNGDLADPVVIGRVFAEQEDVQPFDAVMHFAANSLVGESMTDPFLYLGDNVANALCLLRTMVRHGVGRLVFSSTANLFGDPDDIPIDENAPIDPGSPYGESKYIIERMMEWADRIHGIRAASLRYFNAAGADPGGKRGEDHRPETHLIPIVLQVALGQRPEVEIYGDDYPTRDGTCIRDYIHVSDLAQAHLLSLRYLEQGSCRYNLGNGQGYSVREVIETARKVTGREIPAVVGPRRSGDPPVLVAGSEKIMSELGWRPQFTELETIIQTAWWWHQSRPNGYDTR